MPATPQAIGFGSSDSVIKIYIANRPPIDNYPEMDALRGLAMGELSHIVKHTSNHWRKVFNVYAKFLFDWYSQQERADLPSSWQEYRDTQLFQSSSQEALLFSAPDINDDDSFHIIAGKTYASTLSLSELTWLDAHFAVSKTRRIIVSPYPDYRQLTNERIARLITMMKSFNPVI